MNSPRVGDWVKVSSRLHFLDDWWPSEEYAKSWEGRKGNIVKQEDGMWIVECPVLFEQIYLYQSEFEVLEHAT